MRELDNFIAQCEKNAIPDEKINFTDAPELTENDFNNGHFKNWKPMKKSITFRIDLDNLAWLKSINEKGYQTKMNSVLRWARQNDCPLEKM